LFGVDEKYFEIAKERIEKECSYEIKDSRESSEI
jgi:hypothetical protein